MFIDSVVVHVKAGNGGDGAVKFLREKYIERGGPCGGHGGRGGSIIAVGEEGLTTLIDFNFAKKIKAQNGEKGGDKNCAGKKGENVYIKVPVGTTIINNETGKIIGDITKHGQEVVVAKGGRGGKGNACYSTARNTSPMYAEMGIKGDEFDCKLDLKLLADVGIIGFPSVGKSTLISVVSACKPKIASYHFTTLIPNLGVVSVKDGRSFVMADMPGLIEGASSGVGLGTEFLKHIERTKVLVHLIDMSAMDGRNPIEDYKIIRKELEEFNPKLAEYPEIIVANKMDMPDAEFYIEEFKKEIKKDVIEISAYTKKNLDELLFKIADTLDYERANTKEEIIDTSEVVEYNYQASGPKFTIFMDESGAFNVEGPEIEKLFHQTNFQVDASVRHFAKALIDLGVDAELRRQGAVEGETIIILGYEFEMVA